MKRLLACLILLFIASPVSATVYYVDRVDIDAGFADECAGVSACSTGGVDNTYDPTTRQCGGVGTDKVYPNLSLVDHIVVAGDTVYLRAGIWSTSSDFFNAVFNAGTAANPIWFTSYPSDPVGGVTLTGDADTTGVNTVIGKNYYKVSGLVYGGQFNNITSCVFSLNANYAEITGNTFYGFRAGAIRVDNSNDASGMYNKIYANSGVSIGYAGDDGQGHGYLVFIRGGQFNEVYENKVTGIGHAAIEAEDYPPDARQSKYNKIYNNSINQSAGGGGIYTNSMSSYNLISGNTITGVGGLPGITQNKAGIMLSGSSRSTVRNNWIFDYGVSGSEAHRALMVKTSVSFTNKNAQGNLVYNNLVYGGYGLPFYLRDDSGGHVDACSDYTVQNNTIANNVFYLAPTSKITTASYVGAFTPEAYYVLYLQQVLGAGCAVWPTFANNNEFSNNYIYTGAHGVGENDNYVGYYYGTGGHAAVIGTEEDNYTDDFNDGTHLTTAAPQFVNSAAYNFKLLSDSPLIDAGVQIVDTNGSDVEALYPGYGWASLSFNGVKPDIGPAEYPGVVVPPSTPEEPSGERATGISISLDPSLGRSTSLGN